MSIIAKPIANKLLGNTVKSTFASEDPYYEEVEVTKNGKTKIKRVWKEPPSQGLSPNDHKILKQMTRKAWRLDLVFSMCGLRLGWSAVIGIVPVIGDIINLYLSMQLIKLAQEVDEGLPAFTVSKMMSNVMIDFLLGLTPVLGTIAGALYKANSRNALILEHFLKKRALDNIKKGKYVTDPTAQGNKKSWFSWGRSNKTESQPPVDESILLETQQPAAVKPVEKPVSKPATKPVTKPATKPVTKPDLPPRTPPPQTASPPHLPPRDSELPSGEGQISGTYNN